MTPYEAAGWLYDIQDRLTTLTRQLIGVAGYSGIESRDLRRELNELSQKLVELHVRVLIGLEKEED